MIKVGDKIPSIKLKTKTADGVKDITTDDLFKGKKVALFALPGAFTPRQQKGQALLNTQRCTAAAASPPSSWRRRKLQRATG